jgi:hypothetical protein
MQKCVYNLNVLFMVTFTIALTLNLFMDKNGLCDLLTKHDLVSSSDCSDAEEWGSALDFSVYLIVPVWVYACSAIRSHVYGSPYVLFE